jgi:DNA-binding NarL/FixJ family response regulator
VQHPEEAFHEQCENGHGDQKSVGRAVARGRTNAEIAAELVISLSTVKTHLAGVQRELAARNRTEIAIWAWESRLLT